MNWIRGITGAVLGILFIADANAQTISPSTINAAGGSAVIGGNTHEFSIGEMTMVSTNTFTNGSVTHGVLQPAKVVIESIDDELAFNNQFSIYPNPSEGFLTIDAKGNALPKAINVYDAIGKLVMQVNEKQISLSTKIDLSAHAAGQYVVVLQTTKKNYNIKITKN
jgi:Secretion system C-terminal sorting domain